MQPIIGITCGTDSLTGKVSLSHNYLRAVCDAGALPVMLYLGTEQTEQAVKFLDGLIFSGGGDINTRLAGTESAGNVEDARDAYELALVHAAAHAELPILGICRGIQVINVAFGGTLRGDATLHEQKESHLVSIYEESRLFQLFGEHLWTNTAHHQAVDKVAPGFMISAVARDGMIEGIERGNILGVQWHPERQQDVGVLFGYFSSLCMLAKDRKR